MRHLYRVGDCVTWWGDVATVEDVLPRKNAPPDYGLRLHADSYVCAPESELEPFETDAD